MGSSKCSNVCWRLRRRRLASWIELRFGTLSRCLWGCARFWQCIINSISVSIVSFFFLFQLSYAVPLTAHSHIRHGGWVEVQEVIPTIQCDDGTMAHDDPVRLLFDAATEGMRRLGCQPINPQSIKESLERQGFVNIQCVIKRAPISPWATNGNLQDVGILMKTNIMALIGALAAKPLAALDIAAKDRKSLATYARRSLADDSIHRYVNCCFVYGQKPGSYEE